MLPIILAISDEGDRNFVGDIYNRYGKQMYIIAFDILKKKENAEDCVHDVIKIIINNIKRFRSADYEYLINLIAISFCSEEKANNVFRSYGIISYVADKDEVLSKLAEWGIEVERC